MFQSYITKFNEFKTQVQKLKAEIQKGVKEGMSSMTRKVHNFEVVVLPNQTQGMPREMRQFVVQIPNAYAMKLFGYNFIAVNDEFFTLSDKAQEAFLWHEAGHLHHKHLDQGWFKAKLAGHTRPFKALIGSVCKNELEADGYAAEHVGIQGMIDALEELINAVNLKRNNKFTQMNLASTVKELETRIEYLRNEQRVAISFNI